MSLLCLWQGLPHWKLDDLEVACSCGESGRGDARRGQKDGRSLKERTAHCLMQAQTPLKSFKTASIK